MLLTAPAAASAATPPWADLLGVGGLGCLHCGALTLTPLQLLLSQLQLAS